MIDTTVIVISLLSGVATIVVALAKGAEHLRQRREALQVEVIGVEFQFPGNVSTLLAASYRRFSNHPEEVAANFDVSAASEINYVKSYWKIEITNKDKHRTAGAVELNIPNGPVGLRVSVDGRGQPTIEKRPTSIPIGDLKPNRQAHVDLFSSVSVAETNLEKWTVTSSLNKSVVRVIHPLRGRFAWSSKRNDLYLGLISLWLTALAAYGFLVIIRWIYVLLP